MLRRRRSRGVAAVEFALVASLFLLLLIGTMEVARVLFLWNSANEATRLGARVAVVCDVDSSAVLARMRSILPQLEDDNLEITYVPRTGMACSAADRTGCERVIVGIQGLDVETFIPGFGGLFELPPSRIALSRESLDSSQNCLCTQAGCS